MVYSFRRDGFLETVGPAGEPRSVADLFCQLSTATGLNSLNQVYDSVFFSARNLQIPNPAQDFWTCTSALSYGTNC